MVCFSQVVVIDRGEIAEMGTHDELLEKRGIYRRLVLRQLTAGGMPANMLDGKMEGSVATIQQDTSNNWMGDEDENDDFDQTYYAARNNNV